MRTFPLMLSSFEWKVIQRAPRLHIHRFHISNAFDSQALISVEFPFLHSFRDYS
jgi:hypothetical protein